MAVPSRASVRIKRLTSGVEGPPSVLVDSSPNARTLTKVGVVADRVCVKAKYANGYDFITSDDADHYLKRDDQDLRIPGSLTVFAAVELDTLAGRQAIMGCDAAGETAASNSSYSLEVAGAGDAYPAGTVIYRHETGAGVEFVRFSSRLVGTGFHAFTLVRDAATSRVKVRVDGVVYIDAKVVVPDATTWTSRTSAADNLWQGVAYGGGLFVAVAGSGVGNRVMTSPNGVTWTSRTSAADNEWMGVAYGGGLFVAVSQTGVGNRVMTSPDGITWTSRTSAADNAWKSVAFGNGLFVAVAESGVGNRVMTSPDGVTWTIRTSAADNFWKSVAYGGGLFVAVAQSGAGNRVMTSPDGITWTSRTSAADNEWQGVAHGNGLFVAVSQTGVGNGVMTSPDGVTWTSRTSAADNFWAGVAYGNGLFVAVSFNGTGNRVMTSPDGITWTSRTSAADNGWLGVAYGGDVFAAVADSGTGNRAMTGALDGGDGVFTIGRSNENIPEVWTSRTSGADNFWFAVAYGGGLFVAVAQTGTGNRVMTSPDGITWTTRTSAADNDWTGVAYGGGLFVAVAITGAGNRVMTSPDGVTWTIRTSAADNNWRSVAFGNGLFVAVSQTGVGNRVMTSPDGITWTSRTSAADNNWRSVAFGNGLFVAVAESGVGNRVMTSPDGVTWTIRTSAADNLWKSVAYGGGLFVAVAQTGSPNMVMTSPDGITWTLRTSAANKFWTSVTYGAGLFVAVADGGFEPIVMTSPDGTTWTGRTSAGNQNWKGVAYGGGLFVAVAALGTGNRVMTSPDGLKRLDGGVFEVRVWNNATLSDTLLTRLADPDDGSYAGTPEGTELACWFFGTFPTTTLDVEEDADQPGRRIQNLTVDRPQSVGNQSAHLVARNRGGKFNDWASLQLVRFEARRAQDAAYALLLEGVTDEPAFPGGLHPQFACRISGLNSLLEIASVQEDMAFTDTPYTTIFDAVAQRWFPGYTRVVTPDAAVAADAAFPAGMKVRDALDWCRRGLGAATGTRWEMEVRRDGSTKEIRLYPRATTITRTLGLRDLVGEPVRYAGAMSDVINQATVYGANGPSGLVDRTPPRMPTLTESTISNARFASPFVAKAGGLSDWAPLVGRDTIRTNPTLTGWIARNSDNWDSVQLGVNRRATVLNDDTPYFTAHGNFDDADAATGSQFVGDNSNVFKTVVKYDFGASASPVQIIRFKTSAAVTGVDNWAIDYSDDNVVWTTATTIVGASGSLQTTVLAADQRRRYWRLRYKNDTAHSPQLQTFQLQRLKNRSPDSPTDPEECTDNDVSATGTTISTLNGENKYLFRGYYDTDHPDHLIKVATCVVMHSESQAASRTIEAHVVGTTGGGQTVTLAVLPASASIVTDTIYLKHTQDLARLDVQVQDQAGAGGASTNTLRRVGAVEETVAQAEPLNGAQFGAKVSWASGDHDPPALDDESLSDVALADARSVDEPTVEGKTYWYVLDSPTIPAGQGGWKVQASRAGLAGATALKQNIGSTTWDDAYLDDRFIQALLRFGVGRLTATKRDTTSQLRYAGLVPHGQLVGALSDEVLQTQTMVGREADALVEHRKDPRDRIEVTIPGDTTQDVGNRVTLDQELCFSLGVTDGPQTYDCVGETHDIGPGGWTKRLLLNDHPPGAGRGLRLVAGVASGRTL